MSVRKRIQQLQQITTEDKACNFSDKVDVSITQKPEEEEKQNELPPKYFIGSNLKTMMPQDYREKRKSIKNDKYVHYWETQINELLSVYNSEDDKYHIELVKSIMQITEDFVIFDSKTGQMKKAIVMNICLKFFDDNHKLLSAVIEDQLKNIVHSTLFRRLCSRFQVMFFSKI